MKNFLYKLIFPFCNKLYFGRASDETRYGSKNKPDSQFFGPHHSKEVQKLLDEGEYCYWKVVKVLEEDDNVISFEENYLKKVWKTEDWNSRPSWLLNRSRRGDRGASFGDLNFSRTKEGRVKISKRNEERWKNPEYRETMLQKLQNPAARRKAKDSYLETINSPEYTNPRKGCHRPDVAIATRERWNYDYKEIWNLVSEGIEKGGKRYGRNKLAKQLGVSRPLITLMSKYIFEGLSFKEYMNSTLNHKNTN